VSDHHAIADEFQAFMIERAQGTESEGQLPYSQTGWQVLNEALRELLDGRQSDAFVVTEFGDDVWTLVIVGNAAHLVQLDTTTVVTRFLGRLRGAEYQETFTLTPDQNGVQVTLRLRHESLPSDLELTIAPVALHAHVSAATRGRREQRDLVRKKLREWAAEPAAATT
jgi:hypothetical protein